MPGKAASLWVLQEPRAGEAEPGAGEAVPGAGEAVPAAGTC